MTTPRGSRVLTAIALVLSVSACGSVQGNLDQAAACSLSKALAAGATAIESALRATERGESSEAAAAAREARDHAGVAFDLLPGLRDQGLSDTDTRKLELGIINTQQASVFFETEPEPDHPDLANVGRAIDSVKAVVVQLPDLFRPYGVSCD